MSNNHFRDAHTEIHSVLSRSNFSIIVWRFAMISMIRGYFYSSKEKKVKGFLFNENHKNLIYMLEELIKDLKEYEVEKD